jgi:hypothetical protein
VDHLEQQRIPKFQLQPILESRVASGRPVFKLILLAKLCLAGRPKSNLIQGFPGAETPGSFDTYRAAKVAGVSATAPRLF